MFECEEWANGAWGRGAQFMHVEKLKSEDEVGSQIQAVIWRKLVQCPCGVHKDGIDVVPSVSCRNNLERWFGGS